MSDVDNKDIEPLAIGYLQDKQFVNPGEVIHLDYYQAKQTYIDAFKKGRTSMLAELRAKVPSEEGINEIYFKHVKDGNLNASLYSFKEGFRGAMEKIFGGRDECE